MHIVDFVDLKDFLFVDLFESVVIAVQIDELNDSVAAAAQIFDAPKVLHRQLGELVRQHRFRVFLALRRGCRFSVAALLMLGSTCRREGSMGRSL